MAICYETHKKEELRENLVSIVGLWSDVASKLGITIKQAATFVEDKFVLFELVMYTDHEYTGLWRPTEGVVGEKTAACHYLTDAFDSCASKGWTEESRIEWEFMRITPSEANQIWEEVEKICKPKPHNMRGVVQIEPPKMTVLEATDSKGAGERMTDREFLDRRRELAERMPRARLMPLTAVIQAVSDLTDGTASIHEICNALHGRYDPDTMMLYRGIGTGLADALDGTELDEYSGYNERADIVCEFSNSRYWTNPGQTIFHHSEQYDLDEFLMAKDDGLTLAQLLWEFFAPNQAFDYDRFQTLTKQKSNLSSVGIESIPIPDQSQITSKEPTALPARWPWGNHHTDLLGHLEAAAREFWIGYDPADAKRTAPKNETVIDWLRTERNLSSTKMAEAIATMLRLDGLPPGPRK